MNDRIDGRAWNKSDFGIQVRSQRLRSSQPFPDIRRRLRKTETQDEIVRIGGSQRHIYTTGRAIPFSEIGVIRRRACRNDPKRASKVFPQMLAHHDCGFAVNAPKPAAQGGVNNVRVVRKDHHFPARPFFLQRPYDVGRHCGVTNARRLVEFR